MYISIHAPTNGATVFCINPETAHKHFNPRSDERSDTSPQLTCGNILISIHAPTNGATELTHQPFIVDRFQSTLRRTERRSAQILRTSLELISIHAPTNGATVFIRPNMLTPCDFNPRSDERSDYYPP